MQGPILNRYGMEKSVEVGMCGALPDGPLWGHGLGAVPVRRVAPAGRNPTYEFGTMIIASAKWSDSFNRL